uniref:Uncharacterized protein n=1 Tax=Anguilla anguilla TaxID=7936 RepID=A0A0E9W2P4_ANGAN
MKDDKIEVLWIVGNRNIEKFL